MQQSLNILVVQWDDQSPVAGALCGAGYHVSTARSVAEAITKCYRERFDLVISDVELVDGTGVEVAWQADRWSTPAIVLDDTSTSVLDRVEKAFLARGQQPLAH